MLNPFRTSRLRLAFIAATALAASPAFADALIDNVNGVALDKDGREVRFTGILINDGKVVRLLKRGESGPTGSTGAPTCVGAWRFRA